MASGLLLRDDGSLGLLDSAASGLLKNGIGGAAQEMISLHANMTEMNWATPGAEPAMPKRHVSVNTLHWRRGRQRQIFIAVTRIYWLSVAWRTNEMFAPEDPNPDRARVRLRDIGAAWLLVVLIAASIELPSVFTAARAEAVHAADVARDEIAMVLHAVPGLLQPIALRVTAIVGADAATGR